MKYIKKCAEPSVFIEWKKKYGDELPPWKNFIYRAVKVKQEVIESLLQEQGYICCYCGAVITRDNSHFEHLKPKSHSIYKELRFEYTNLALSCNADYDDKPRVPRHCGHIKDEWYDENLFVSPLDPNCESSFMYNALGEILPTDDVNRKDAAKTTIEKLGLNIEFLKARRVEAIDIILEETLDLTNEEIQLLIDSYQKPDASGKYTQFCTAIIYYLKNYCLV